MDPRMITEDFAPIESHVYAALQGTTHTVYAIPNEWKGRKIVFHAIGGSLWILFGTSATMEVDRTAYSTGTPPAITVNAKTGKHIPQDGWGEVRIPKKVDGVEITHFAVESDAAGGSWDATYESLTDY